MPQEVKKLVSVLSTFLLMTVISKKAIPEYDIPILKKLELQLVSYIYYLVQFREELLQTFIDLESELNIINPTVVRKLNLHI